MLICWCSTDRLNGPFIVDRFKRKEPLFASFWNGYAIRRWLVWNRDHTLASSTLREMTSRFIESIGLTHHVSHDSIQHFYIFSKNQCGQCRIAQLVNDYDDDDDDCQCTFFSVRKIMQWPMAMSVYKIIRTQWPTLMLCCIPMEKVVHSIHKHTQHLASWPFMHHVHTIDQLHLKPFCSEQSFWRFTNTQFLLMERITYV